MAKSEYYLSGELRYAYLFEEKDRFDRYSVAVLLEGDQVKNARNIGLKVNQRDDKYDGMAYVQLKTLRQPKVIDGDRNEYTGPKKLGPGTRGVVKVTQMPYNNKFGTGTTTFIDTVQITEAVEYDSDFKSSKDDSAFKSPFESSDEAPF